jgi:hypothetical protein
MYFMKQKSLSFLIWSSAAQEQLSSRAWNQWSRQQARVSSHSPQIHSCDADANKNKQGDCVWG